jgi:hypothetical protein
LREEDVLEQIGSRLLPLLGCLTRFHAELANALEELGLAINDGARVALKGKAGQLGHILQWTEAVSEDLTQEATHAAAGRRRVDTADLIRRLGREMEERHSGMRITVSSQAADPCWGRVEDLKEMLRLGLDLTRLRIRGKGAITVEVESDARVVTHRILGLGEAVALNESEATGRFAALLKSFGATVRPDSLGVDGTGMIIELPLADPR